jgi:hypothetical protein
VNDRTVETHTARIFAKFGPEAFPETHRRVLAVRDNPVMPIKHLGPR